MRKLWGVKKSKKACKFKRDFAFLSLNSFCIQLKKKKINRKNMENLFFKANSNRNGGRKE